MWICMRDSLSLKNWQVSLTKTIRSLITSSPAPAEGFIRTFMPLSEWAVFGFRDGTSLIILVNLSNLGHFVHIDWQTSLWSHALYIDTNLRRQSIPWQLLKTVSVQSGVIGYTLLLILDFTKVVTTLAATLSEWALQLAVYYIEEAWDLVSLCHCNWLAREVHYLVWRQFQVQSHLKSLLAQIVAL